MKAAIVLDDWKLPFFEKHLKAGGFAYTTKGSLTPGTVLLSVETDRMQQLGQTVLAAYKDAARTGAPK